MWKLKSIKICFLSLTLLVRLQSWNLTNSCCLVHLFNVRQSFDLPSLSCRDPKPCLSNVSHTDMTAPYFENPFGQNPPIFRTNTWEKTDVWKDSVQRTQSGINAIWTLTENKNHKAMLNCGVIIFEWKVRFSLFLVLFLDTMSAYSSKWKDIKMPPIGLNPKLMVDVKVIACLNLNQLSGPTFMVNPSSTFCLYSHTLGCLKWSHTVQMV